MKQHFGKAFKIYKYLFLIYTIIYWIGIYIDDYVFIEKYGLTIEGILIWAAYYLAFLIGGSLYYWLPVSTAILIYHKIILPRHK